MKIQSMRRTSEFMSKIPGHARLALVTVFFSLASFGIAHASDAQPGTPAETATRDLSPAADFCFLSGAPPSDVRYSRIRDLKLGKGSYGSVTDIVGRLAEQARMLGADAMINYTGSQRFGFWPWRMVRPVVRGTAVKWEGPTKPDCKAIGGSTLSEILISNRPPGS